MRRTQRRPKFAKIITIMSEVIKLKRGLDIQLVGAAEKRISVLPLAASYAVCPEDYRGVTPKLLVNVDDRVKAGGPLFFDKSDPRVMITSPVSGRVSAIRRGDKRKILSIVVEADRQQEYAQFQAAAPEKSAREKIVETLLSSGLWAMIIQRPYGTIADPGDNPKAIFVSGFDSAPLAPDMNFALDGEYADLEAGIQALRKLTDGKVHLGLRRGDHGVLFQLGGTEQHLFSGPHPAGNVGVQIHHIDPVNKGEVVWTVDVQNVAIIGRLFNTGRVDMRKTIALTGSQIVNPHYVSVIAGAPILQVAVAGGVKRQRARDTFRIIIGNVLTGKKSDADGYIDIYHNQVTFIPEGDKYEFLGWAMPRLDKFSVSRTYFSWLFPRKKYNIDTNLHGGPRALVVTGLFDRYLPMDIYPMYLVKACMAGDIDRMENLGIYEVIEEDLALCEFVDPSKTEIQSVIRNGIDLMIKELG